MNLKRLHELKEWIHVHHDNGMAIQQLNGFELSEVNAYRKKMGPAPITLAQVIDRMIADKEKEVVQ